MWYCPIDCLRNYCHSPPRAATVHFLDADGTIVVLTPTQTLTLLVNTGAVLLSLDFGSAPVSKPANAPDSGSVRNQREAVSGSRDR
jgi:hypothetical protein